jgi:hypothetical protein
MGLHFIQRWNHHRVAKGMTEQPLLVPPTDNMWCGRCARCERDDDDDDDDIGDRAWRRGRKRRSRHVTMPDHDTLLMKMLMLLPIDKDAHDD